MKNKKNIIILLSMGLIFCLIPFLCGKLFGSNMDWVNQHIVFADYFRNLFYETGDLIPNISWNLGLGQNIYNFSYYGLLNPIILISYFLPFISMTNYIMFSSVLLYLFSIYLFYTWINEKFDNKISFLLTFMFSFCGPLFYHFHRQIMFVNYIPFLILALKEIDKNKKYSIFFITIFITLMIFTSYYYSIGGIVCIMLYYFYAHFKDKLLVKLSILIPVIISLLLSGILIIPTFYAILSGRNDIKSTIDIISLFIPKTSFDDVLYGSYTLGITAIVVPSIIGLILCKDKKNKYLGIILSLFVVFPIFRYLLNGSLYVRSKVLIPFLPLYIFSIGIFLRDLLNKKNYNKVLKIVLILSLISFLTGNLNFGYYLDLIISFIIIKLFMINKKSMAYLLLMLEVLGMFIIFNLDESYVDKNIYHINKQYNEEVSDLLQNDNTFYRFADNINPINNANLISNNNYYKTSLYSSVYNYNYYNFYHNALNTSNITYNHLMLVDNSDIIKNRLLGVKYIVSDKKLGFGYKLLKEFDNYYLYENIYNISIGYASSNLYNKTYVDNYDYPYNLEALLTGIVVDSNYYNFNTNYINDFNVDYDILLGENISISNNDDFNILEITNDSKIKVDFKEPIINKLLFIEINGLEENTCNTNISMEINGIENILTCKEWNYPNKNNSFHFLISDDIIDSLNINLSKGTYKISNIKMYTMDKDIFLEKFDLLENIKINNNKLTGDINVSENGYMALSIPYDDGFIVKVDDKEVQLELVNDGFIGFKINKGYHKIEVIYNSPYYKIGLFSSVIGLILLIAMISFFNTKCSKK